jgi:hypothetical protein
VGKVRGSVILDIDSSLKRSGITGITGVAEVLELYEDFFPKTRFQIEHSRCP